MSQLPEQVQDRLSDILKQRARLAQWQENNACDKHGVQLLQEPSEILVKHRHEHEHVAAQPVPEQPEQPTPNQSRWKNWAYPAAIMAALAGGGYGAYWLGSQSNPSDNTEQPEKDTDTTDAGGLLQYLEEEGMHLPRD